MTPPGAASGSDAAPKTIFQCRAYLRLWAARVAGVSGGIVATLFLPMVAFGLELPKEANWLLLVYFVMGAIAIPPMVWISRRLGKHQTFVAHCLANAIMIPCIFFLPKGEFNYRGKLVDLATIGDTALLAIEGERDDISGIGQTRAALTLATGLPEKKKRYFLAEGVGHYGIFNGSKWRTMIAPVVEDWIRAHD